MQELDSIDSAILNRIQSDFPITPRPYLAVADDLASSKAWLVRNKPIMVKVMIANTVTIRFIIFIMINLRGINMSGVRVSECHGFLPDTWYLVTQAVIARRVFYAEAIPALPNGDCFASRAMTIYLF